MNQNENLEITIPSTEYLQNSRLIQKIGFQTTNYTNTYEDYWTNTISDYYTNCYTFFDKVNRFGQLTGNKINTYCGVRPILKGKQIPEIVNHTKKTVKKNGLTVIPFGNWYKAKPSSLNVKIQCYPNNNTYMFVNTDLYNIAPLTWYYDEKANLLLSEKILFSSPIVFSSHDKYNGIFKQSDLYKILNTTFANQAFHQNIISKKLIHKI